MSTNYAGKKKTLDFLTSSVKVLIDAEAEGSPAWSLKMVQKGLAHDFFAPPDFVMPDQSLPIGLLTLKTRKPTSGEVFYRFVYLYIHALSGQEDEWAAVAHGLPLDGLGTTYAERVRYGLYLKDVNDLWEEKDIANAWKVPALLYKYYGQGTDFAWASPHMMYSLLYGPTTSEVVASVAQKKGAPQPLLPEAAEPGLFIEDEFENHSDRANVLDADGAGLDDPNEGFHQPLDRYNALFNYLNNKESVLDDEGVKVTYAVPAMMKKGAAPRGDFATGIAAKTNFRWVMSQGTTRDRKERVASVLMRLQNAAQQIRRECWDVVPVQDVSEQVELHDIKKLPSFWRSYHLLDDVVNVPPPVEHDVDDVDDGSKSKSKKPAAKKVLKKVSRVTRKPSKTLDLIMTDALEEAGLNDPRYDIINATSDTGKLLKWTVFHLDGFVYDDPQDSYQAITRLRNLMLFAVYNPYKSTASRVFQTIKQRAMQYYIQPHGAVEENFEAYRTAPVVSWNTFLVRTPAAKNVQDQILTDRAVLKGKAFAFRVRFSDMFAKVQSLLKPINQSNELNFSYLVLYVQCCIGLRLNEVFRPDILIEEVSLEDEQLRSMRDQYEDKQVFESKRWIRQVGTSKTKELRAKKYGVDTAVPARTTVKPIAFFARSDRIIKALVVIRAKAREKWNAKFPQRRYEDAEPRELTIMFGQTVNRQMVKVFATEAEYAAEMGIPFGSHWCRALYANVAYDQFADELVHTSKPAFIAEALLHAPGNLDTTVRYSNIIVQWHTIQKMAPAVENTMWQFKAFADWAQGQIQTLSGAVSRVGHEMVEPLVPLDTVRLKDVRGHVVELRRLRHVRTRDEEKRMEFVTRANHVLQEANVPPTTQNFVSLGVSAGFVVRWRRRYPGLVADPEEAYASVGSDGLSNAQRTANRTFLNHVIKFKSNRWSYMKREWLDMWQGWKDREGPPLRGSDNPMTLPQLLDTERFLYPRELFYYFVWDFLDNFAEDDDVLKDLYMSKGNTWVRETEKWYPGIVVPASPFLIIPELYRGRMAAEREHNLKTAPLVYKYLYTPGPGATVDMADGAMHHMDISNASGFDIAPDTVLQLAGMPDGDIVELAEEAEMMSAGVPDSERDPKQKSLREKLRQAAMAASVAPFSLPPELMAAAAAAGPHAAPGPAPAAAPATNTEEHFRRSFTAFKERMAEQGVNVNGILQVVPSDYTKKQSQNTIGQRNRRIRTTMGAGERYMTTADCVAHAQTLVNRVPRRLEVKLHHPKQALFIFVCVDAPRGVVIDYGPEVVKVQRIDEPLPSEPDTEAAAAAAAAAALEADEDQEPAKKKAKKK